MGHPGLEPRLSGGKRDSLTCARSLSIWIVEIDFSPIYKTFRFFTGKPRFQTRPAHRLGRNRLKLFDVSISGDSCIVFVPTLVVGAKLQKGATYPLLDGHEFDLCAGSTEKFDRLA